ncbi:hypothetical protein LG047_00485 [Methylocystis sp. WRRC1]|uniref:hypothetical protein n=1 Tax=Methylocystis sp. WRRC1 TaxID=1732014 RepID=UPI001D135BD5|nr:hypothetical protein [Methylocystis sp. WRRC1]MCC3243813.1 hypothetical protein [Methylocystis sp. WRRC1]
MAKMPAIAVYRQCEIHAFQNQERVENVVCREIDDVYLLHDVGATEPLIAWAADGMRSPESRLLAARHLAEPAAAAAAQRRKVTIDRPYVAAAVSGLGRLESASDAIYGAKFHPGPPPGVHFPARPAEHAEALRAAQTQASKE